MQIVNLQKSSIYTSEIGSLEQRLLVALLIAFERNLILVDILNDLGVEIDILELYGYGFFEKLIDKEEWNEPFTLFNLENKFATKENYVRVVNKLGKDFIYRPKIESEFAITKQWVYSDNLGFYIDLQGNVIIENKKKAEAYLKNIIEQPWFSRGEFIIKTTPDIHELIQKYKKLVGFDQKLIKDRQLRVKEDISDLLRVILIDDTTSVDNIQLSVNKLKDQIF